MKRMSLEERIQRLEDIHEIQNLMGRHEYLHMAGLHRTDAERMFAQKTPDVRIEVADWGVYEGNEGIERFHHGLLPYVEGDDREGIMALHTLTTSVIEVAGDAKTAKAVWISPGVETLRIEGKLLPMWTWLRYGCDFVKEDGQWKIWHLHVYAIFSPPYDKSWVESPEHPPTPPVPDELKADRPTTYHREYSPNLVCECVPAPPEPYETWDESTSYIK